MRVHGQSGHLHVHTDHNITAVDSRSGKLEIYIKNPDHHFGTAEEHAAEHHSKVSVEVIASEAYKKNKLMTSNKLKDNIRKPSLLHITDITGVKKSRVIAKQAKHQRGN